MVTIVSLLLLHQRGLQPWWVLACQAGGGGRADGGEGEDGEGDYSTDGL